MSWWNPASWGRGDDPNQTLNGARNNLNMQGGAAGAFANLGQSNYDVGTSQLNGTYGQLGNAMQFLNGQMRGENSVSAEQLRQGLGQTMSQQRSMAASASPQNSAMAARTAAMNMGRLGAGMSGQAALAGIQERNAAAQQYGQLGSALGQLQLGARGQDVNVANGARQNAINGYGQVLGAPQNKGWLEQNANTLSAIGTALGVTGDDSNAKKAAKLAAAGG
jgi:hypothetical protein